MSSPEPLLHAIGQRLRAQRVRVGLTQAQLAESSKVSPRFLVQLEKGEGNISVQRLAAVCAELSLPLSKLFEGLGPGQSEKIALVGLRGAGKSTIGAALARRLGVEFVELDAEISARAGMSIGEIFELWGEAHYRSLEDRVLAEVLGRQVELVVAAGGGIVTSVTAWKRLQEGAQTVWLRASPASHLARVQAQGDLRPMRGRADAQGELRAILAEREPLYSRAQRVVDTDRLGIEGVVELLAGQDEAWS
jgi:XRE family aerobic/anaerobic benzoate catabolism transcriptional regulator